MLTRHIDFFESFIKIDIFHYQIHSIDLDILLF